MLPYLSAVPPMLRPRLLPSNKPSTPPAAAPVPNLAQLGSPERLFDEAEREPLLLLSIMDKPDFNNCSSMD